MKNLWRVFGRNLWINVKILQLIIVLGFGFGFWGQVLGLGMGLGFCVFYGFGQLYRTDVRRIASVKFASAPLIRASIPIIPIQ